MSHQPSAPTPQYGAPALPITSPHGRCALCSKPILSSEKSRHVPTTPLRYATDQTIRPIPYQHTECPA